MSEPQLAKPVIHSLGYEGRVIDEVVELLVAHNVDVLVDVRLTPISRKQGFSKTALREALTLAGIEYRHERALGNPKDNRDDFRNQLRAARERYEIHLSNGAQESFRAVLTLTQSRRIALLCYESEHSQCHRSSIALRAVTEVPGTTIVEL